MSFSPLHPITYQKLKMGHPWVTKDEFSSRLKSSSDLIELGQNGKTLGYFLFDPGHPRVVARFWSQAKDDFRSLLGGRIKQSVARRFCQKWERENIYLVFGEADQLPGLYIQKLANTLLIQFNCFVWSKYLPLIQEILGSVKQLKSCEIWTQQRIPTTEKLPPAPTEASHSPSLLIDELGIKLEIRLDTYHDIGLFTDMSAIREKLYSSYPSGGKILNLFAYTGAFSLKGLKENNTVTSVDLSRNYMEWLESNLGHNGFDLNKHHALVMACDKALQKLKNNGETFDLIICDPPTFSSNKKRQQSAIDFYKSNLSQITELCGKRGSLFLVLNTHKVSAGKFSKLITEQLKQAKRPFDIKSLGMGADCPASSAFPEGNYLKCLLIRFKN